jgi:predicted metal-dependent peptidase
MTNLIPINNNDVAISINFNELNNNLQRVKKQLLFKRNMGLLGGILCSTELIFSYDVPTAATNGKWIKFNPDYWITLNNEYKIFLLAHELFHIALMHAFRCLSIPDLNQRKYNIAGDIVINNLLVQYGFFMPKDGVYEPKYTGMTTEQVYDDLDIDDYNQDPQDIIPNDSDIDLEEIILNIKMLQQGNDIVDEIDTFINNRTKPKLNWKDLLKNYLTDLSNKSNYTYRRPRKINNFILPKLKKLRKLTKLNFYIDTSGSITDHEIKLFFAELNSIKNSLNPNEMNVICFDEKIQKEYTFKDNQSLDTFEIVGRGGTDLHPVIDHINQHSPSCAIIMTDLGVDIIPNKPKNTDIVWINTCESSTLPTYGRIITINPQEYND